MNTVTKNEPLVISCRKTRNLFLAALFVRLMSVFIVRTSFVPDEYWQSLEVAHYTVFGYGTLTWEWREKIRGFLYPGIIAILYKSLELFHLDGHSWLLINLPRILQAVLTAWSDCRLHIVAGKLFDSRTADLTYILQLCSWFVFYVGSRTLTNTAEMALGIIGLSYLPIGSLGSHGAAKGVLLASTCGIFACIIRPTAATIWFPVFIWTVFNVKVTDLRYCILTVPIIFLLSISLDSFFYGAMVLVPWEFFKFNVVHNIAVFYGTHPWHWYLTQGLPAIAMPQALLLLPGITKIEQSTSYLPLSVILTSIFVYSTQSHKEFRFLLPILPLIHCYCGHGLMWFSKGLNKSTGSPKKEDTSVELSTFAASLSSLTKTGRQILGSIIIVNAVAALYFGMYHQRGTISVMQYLRDEAKRQPNKTSVLFSMPCHSTPFYSHIHQQIPLRQLDCSPSNAPNYIDEAEVFYKGPIRWLSKQYPGNAMPSHVVMFNVLQQGIAKWLEKNKYYLCATFPHTHFNEGRIGTEVLVYCGHKRRNEM